MTVNYNIRVLGNGAVFVQYLENGKACDAAFMNWGDFITWLSGKVLPNEITS